MAFFMFAEKKEIETTILVQEDWTQKRAPEGREAPKILDPAALYLRVLIPIDLEERAA